jgi:hypothetical protein
VLFSLQDRHKHLTIHLLSTDNQDCAPTHPSMRRGIYRMPGLYPMPDW